MSQELVTQLEIVCQRRRRRRWLAATCWALSAIILVGLLLVGLDHVLGTADLAWRILLTSLFGGALIWVYRRWSHEVGQISLTPLTIAREVEHRYPSLRGTLASAWEFAGQNDNDPTAGSEALRRAVVLQASAGLDQIDWEDMIPRRPLQRGAWAIAVITLATAVISWCLPQGMAIGVMRLTNPFSLAEWPRDHDLQFVDPPLLVAEGDDLVLKLRDTNGNLPERVTMQYRSRRGGRWEHEEQDLNITEHPQEILRPNVRQSLQFRAVGGDHNTMPWHALEVVAPPQVQQLELTVNPPAYTSLPPHTWDPNSTVFSGSHLELQGRFDQTVTQVVLKDSDGAELVAQVEANGQSFRIGSGQWKVTRSDKYHLHFTNSRGLNSRENQEITLEVVDDQPPTVRFLGSSEELKVLPSAKVVLEIEATDELSVRQMELVARRSDRSADGVQKFLLWASSNELADQPVFRSKRIKHQLDLALWSLAPGTLVELHAQASDAQPMTGQSARALRLQIVSEDELWTELLQQQARLAEMLATLLREQRELLSITDQWSELPSWPRTRWTSSGHAALFRQREVVHTLGSGQGSILSQLNDTLDAIRRNKLQRPTAVDRLEAVRRLSENLLAGPLLQAVESLAEMTRQTRRSSQQAEILPLIVTISEQQQLAVTDLRRAIELLMPGNVVGQLERDLAELENDQKKLLEFCEIDLAPKLLGSSNFLTQHEENLDGAVRGQRDLSRRLAELLLTMSQATQRLADHEPSTAARLAETVDLARQLSVQATIQSAAEHLSRRRVGNATLAQRNTLEQLAELRAVLSGRDTKATAQRLQELQATERELQRLRRKASALEKKLQDLSPEQLRRVLERLRRQREQLALELDQIARELERLQIPKAAKPAAEAGSHLRQATLDSQTTKQARKKLEEAQRALTTERRRQQAALAQLQMAQLDAKLKALVGLQESIVQEIHRLDGLREETGQLTDPQLQSVQLLAERQTDLRDDVLAQAEQLESLPVFDYLLQEAAETMQRVAESLEQSQTGPRTQSGAESVVFQLRQILDSVNQERQELADTKQQDGGSEGQQAGDTPQAQTLQLALGQLKLLKTLQTNLRHATEAMEAALARGDQPAQSAEELAQRQQELTELARQLVPQPLDPPIEAPIPDLDTELEKSLDELLLPEL